MITVCCDLDDDVIKYPKFEMAAVKQITHRTKLVPWVKGPDLRQYYIYCIYRERDRENRIVVIGTKKGIGRIQYINSNYISFAS
jgi:hypothetical protein